MKKTYLVIATPLLLLTTFALFLFSLPMTQSTVEAQRDRSRVRVTKTATPEGFVATPSPTPGIKPGGGGCGDTTNYGDFDIFSYLGYVINNQNDVITIYGDPEFYEILPEHALSVVAVYQGYYSGWMLTLDDGSNDFYCADEGINGKPKSRTYLWSHEDLSAPVVIYDKQWQPVEPSPWGDAFFGMQWLPEDERRALDIIFLEDPATLRSVDRDVHVVDAQWTMEGRLAVLTAPSSNDSSRELRMIDPVTGEVVAIVEVANDSNQVLIGDSLGNVWVKSDTMVTQHNVYDNTSVDLFMPHQSVINTAFYEPELLRYWNSEWTRFVLPVMSADGQIYVYDEEDIDNPITLDMSDAFTNGTDILSVAWTLDGEELLLGFMGSVAWWSNEGDEPRLVDLIPITLTSDSDGEPFTYGASPTELFWLLDDTMIIVGTEDLIDTDESLQILDLTNGDPLQVLNLEWIAINFSEDQETANIVLADNRLMQLNLLTLELTEVDNFDSYEPYYEPIPTPNPDPDFVCDGALPPHLLVSTNGQVTIGENAILDVYAEASYDSEKLGILPDSTLVEILNGPVCGDNGEVWYFVRELGGDFITGWTTVSGNGEYWIVATDEKFEFGQTSTEDTSIEDTSTIATEEPIDTDTAIVTEDSDSDAIPPPPPLPDTGGFGDLLLIYDDTSFTAINISGNDIDFSQVTFYTDSGDGFFGSYWDNEFLKQPINAFPTDSCLQVWVQGFNDLPTPLECGTRQNWVSGFGIDTFWREDPEFYVGYADEYVATCDSTFGICEVDLP